MPKKKVLIILAFLSLLLMGFSVNIAPATHANQATNVVFKTPEEAVTFYMQGVTQGDFDKVLQACAIDEMSQNFKFDLSIDRLKSFTPYQSLSPANAQFFIDLNKAQLSSQIGNQVRILVYSLLSDQAVSDGSTIIMNIEGATKFMSEVDVNKLTQLQVKKIGLPNKKMMSTTKYTDLETKIAQVYGADEATERVALFSFGSDYYFVGFSILRYGDNWKIYSQSSPMSNATSIGAPVKTTPDDFDSLIGDK